MISTSLLDSRGRRTRTLDIWFWRPTFYQLNYAPIYFQNFTQTLKNVQPSFGSPMSFVHRTTRNTNLNLPFTQLSPSVSWSSPRPISNSQLHALPHFHLCPIYLIVSQGSYFLMDGISHLGGGFTLRCLQRLSLPDLATLPWDWFPTGTPVVRPARSSRTKASSPQISSARAG